MKGVKSAKTALSVVKGLSRGGLGLVTAAWKIKRFIDREYVKGLELQVQRDKKVFEAIVKGDARVREMAETELGQIATLFPEADPFRVNERN